MCFKTVFRTAHYQVFFGQQDAPAEYSKVVKDIVLSSIRLDEGAYSEPIMYIRLFAKYQKLSWSEKTGWVMKNNIVKARMDQFFNSANDLIKRVSKTFTANHGSTPFSNGSYPQKRHERISTSSVCSISTGSTNSDRIDIFDPNRLQENMSASKLNMLRLIQV